MTPHPPAPASLLFSCAKSLSSVTRASSVSGGRGALEVWPRGARGLSEICVVSHERGSRRPGLATDRLAGSMAAALDLSHTSGVIRCASPLPDTFWAVSTSRDRFIPAKPSKSCVISAARQGPPESQRLLSVVCWFSGAPGSMGVYTRYAPHSRDAPGHSRAPPPPV